MLWFITWDGLLQALTSLGLGERQAPASYCRNEVNHEFQQAALPSLAPLGVFLKGCPAFCYVFPLKTILQSYPTSQPEP